MKKLYILTAALVLAGGVLSAQQSLPLNGPEAAPAALGGGPNPTPQTPWQLLYSYDITAAGAGIGNAGVVILGTEMWVAKWASDTISSFTLTGTLNAQFTVPGVTGIRSLTTDGSFIYAGANTSSIFKINPATRTLIGTINVPTVPNIRYCTYDPALPGFWVGSWATDITLVNMTGTATVSVPASSHLLTATYGLAYDGVNPGGPYLWAFHQTGTANNADLIQVNIASGVQTSVIHDVTSDIGTSGDLAGGICIVPAPVLSIVGVLQGTPNYAFAYDIAGLVGVNEATAAQGVAAFPNPANEMVNIKVDRTTNEPMTIQMFDVTGRIVFESNTVGANNYISMAGFEAGIYTVKVTGNDQVSTTQVVKN